MDYQKENDHPQRWQEDKEGFRLDPSEIAISNLPKPTREIIFDLREMGYLKIGDFDYRAVAELAKLPEEAQVRVMEWLRENKIFLANAHSSSGFLVSSCAKAKRGELDVRGFGQSDPYIVQLRMGALRKKSVELIKEGLYIERFGRRGPFKVVVNVLAAPEMQKPIIDLEVNLQTTVGEVKQMLALMGIQMPHHKMVLKHEVCGPLRNTRTLAFYNMQPSSNLLLSRKERGGFRRHKSKNIRKLM